MSLRRRLRYIGSALTITLGVVLGIALSGHGGASAWVIFGLLAAGDALVLIGMVVVGVRELERQRLNRSGD